MVELGELVELLPADGLDITITGFQAAEIDILEGDLGGDDPGDDLPAELPSVVTRRGDLWLLGPHRRLCADARSKEDLDRVMLGTAAWLVVTDPPYNVRIAGHVQGRGRNRHAEFAFASGEMSDAEFQAFLSDSLQNAARCADKTFRKDVPGGTVEIHVTDVDLYPSKDSLAVGLKIDAKMPRRWFDTTGWVFLSGKPVVVADGKAVQIDEVRFATVIDNAFWAATQAVFQDQILKAIKAHATFDLSVWL